MRFRFLFNVGLARDYAQESATHVYLDYKDVGNEAMGRRMYKVEYWRAFIFDYIRMCLNGRD